MTDPSTRKALVLGWALLLKARNRTAFRVALTRPYTIALLLWTGWIVVGVPLALDPTLAWDYLLGAQIKELLFCLFLMSVLSRRRQPRNPDRPRRDRLEGIASRGRTPDGM